MNLPYLNRIELTPLETLSLLLLLAAAGVRLNLIRAHCDATDLVGIFLRTDWKMNIDNQLAASCECRVKGTHQIRMNERFCLTILLCEVGSTSCHQRSVRMCECEWERWIYMRSTPAVFAQVSVYAVMICFCTIMMCSQRAEYKTYEYILRFWIFPS